ncbi:MAG: PBSX family phage terminase large subunit [Chitinophagales bacterium]|nr:PBSX family phage terminase large subunit [Chitinophagales bacterium]
MSVQKTLVPVGDFFVNQGIEAPVAPKKLQELGMNKKFLALLGDHHRYLVLYGGAGSGKSHFVAQKLLQRIINEPNHRILICRKVARTIRNSQYLLFKDLVSQMGKEDEFTFNDSRLDITHRNGNQIISTGIDDREKLKSLARPTSIWVEEATELDQQDFRQLDLRLRAVHDNYMQIVLTFNPITKAHWLYQQFVTREKQNAHIVHSTWHDNEFLDDDYKGVLESLALEDPNYYKVYSQGEWGDYAEGLIYRYSIVEAVPMAEQIIYGLDFGYHHPTALVRIHIKERNAYIEEVLYKKGLLNSELADMLPNMVYPKGAEIYADAAEPDRIEEIYRKGLNIRPAAKEVLQGIDQVKRFKLHVLKGSQNLIREMDGYQWKSDNKGYPLEMPSKTDDHAMDALRYALHSHFGKRRAIIHGFV